MPEDDWAVLLRAARAGMNNLREEVLTTRMRQLRATPSDRLMSGRSRRDLCRLLADGGLLWPETVTCLRDDPDAGRLDWLFDQQPAPVAGPETDTGANGRSADLQARIEELSDELDRARERARGFLDQRDDARRRADGLEARLGTERSGLEKLESERDGLRAERDRLRERLATTEERHREALERERRRHDAEQSELREKLRRFRRREEQRRQRHRRRERRDGAGDQEGAAARRRAREEVDQYLSSRGETPTAGAGRPIRLPPDVGPDTTEAARLLLEHSRCLLVDGYNVTQQYRPSASLEHQRQWLVRVLRGLAARRKVAVTVVFDGDPDVDPGSGPTSGRGVSVDFTRGDSADDRLVDLVADLPPATPTVVVTDDRDLRGRVESYAVNVLGVRGFVSAAE